MDNKSGGLVERPWLASAAEGAGVLGYLFTVGAAGVVFSASMGLLEGVVQTLCPWRR